MSGPGAEVAGPAPAVRLRPMGIGEMLDAAIKVYRSRPRDMVLAAVLVTLPAVVLQVLVQLSAGSPNDLTRTDAETGLLTLDGSAFAVWVGGTVVSTVLLLVANNLALAGTTRLSLSAYLGDTTTWQESLRYAFRRFWPLTAVLLVSTLGILVGTVLCLLPGLWLQTVWAVAVPALLVEERGAMASLGRSQQLVKGRFWPVLGTILLGSLLASLLQGLLVAPVVALQLLEASFLLTSLLSGLAQLVSNALVVPFVAALTAVIYVDLRVRKEGFDLELMARGVGVDPGALPPAPAPPAPVAPVAPPGGWGRPAAPPSGPLPVPPAPPADPPAGDG